MPVLEKMENSTLSSRNLSLIITEMTQLFFEEIDPACHQGDVHKKTEKILMGDMGSIHGISGMTWFNQRKEDSPAKRKSSELGKRIALNVYHRNDSHSSVRWFVRRLSHAYNNVLMGILGNITLIGMDCRKDTVVRRKIHQIECLITSAANLTHLLFGYLSERRIPAKKLQLMQLLSAIEKTIQTAGKRKAFDGLKKCMHTIGPIHNRMTVATSLGAVMEQQFGWIKAQCTQLNQGDSIQTPVHYRLSRIDELIENGYNLVHHLQLYSGKNAPCIKRTSLRSLIQKQIKRLESATNRVRISGRLPKSLPWLHVDPKQLDMALNALTDNAMQAMPEGGKLRIGAKMLYDELPTERCAVHAGGDYVVISIADTGHGMDLDTQARIFEPFFRKKHQPSKHSGLGLCAACGIVKAHGGYIQVRSTQGKGSIFKIYLPLRNNPFLIHGQTNLLELEYAA
jgi:signal transduction histidine kinase